ncbi:MAG TPA: DUF547 domain-containing protein [Saprospiraceae bacterium]|nr:DUF547 domain-containing protein [Saprospiraceae bacterium]
MAKVWKNVRLKTLTVVRVILGQRKPGIAVFASTVHRPPSTVYPPPSMFKHTFFSTLLLASLFSNLDAQVSLTFSQDTTSKPAAVSAAPSHAGLDSLLQKYVSETGKVNYKGLKTSKPALDAYCQVLSDNPVQDAWTNEEKMAYWINAYNAFTLQLILDNYPTKSILSLDGGKTWDVKRITLDDKKYSLNQIENEILRPQFKDARIHFAINCAAKSCPPLWNKAYTAENLYDTLEARAKAFINNSQYNTITPSQAQVSKIFEWYADDFGDLKNYLNIFLKTPLKNNATVTFREYNWGLNE